MFPGMEKPRVHETEKASVGGAENKRGHRGSSCGIIPDVFGRS